VAIETASDGTAVTMGAGPDSVVAPWRAAYPPGLDWGVEIAEAPVWHLLDKSVSAHPERPCIDFLGRKYSYREIGALVGRAAKGLQGIGVGPGTQLGLFLPNCPYAVIFYFAALKAGATVVNFNPLYAEPEIARQITDSDTDVMVTLDLSALCNKVTAQIGKTRLKTVIVCPMADSLPYPKRLLFPIARRKDMARWPRDAHHVGYRDLIANDGKMSPPPIAPQTDLAVLQYTGGTTGVPKGAMLSHANVYANAVQSSLWFGAGNEGRQSILGILPLFHVFAMTVVMNWSMRVGGEMILLPRLDLKQLLQTITDKKPTAFAAVPTLLTAINNYPDLAKYALSSLKVCVSGGAPLPADVRDTFERLTGCRVVEGYGLSECAPVVCCNPIEGQRKPGSVGLPYPGTTVEVVSLEPPRRVLLPGEKGEICVRGPQVMRGYWKRPEATAEVMIDGRLHTGDIGHIDADGYVFITDRLKEMINAGGYKIYPRMVEEAIYAHPQVAECAVFGVPDPYRGETVKAVVKLAPGAILDAEALSAFLAERLSAIELPKIIEFRSDLPKSAVGKILKTQLVAEHNSGDHRSPVP
jgi:long-chain acyl-CoA synthetase